jgi:sulfate adenylyltransferase
VHGLTGLDDPYEPPASPELTLDTSRVTPAEAAAAVLALLGAGAEAEAAR